MRDDPGSRERYVLGLEEIDRAQVALAGGKGANLGELSKVEDVRVPPGFCVTTTAFRRVVDEAIAEPLGRLSRLSPEDSEASRALGAEIRAAIEATTLPRDVASAIAGALVRLGQGAAYAVRSSATAEDSPAASFAGQLDTTLNVVGEAAILEHVRRCWASLFTDRAVVYRQRHGLDHRKVATAVVVQQMISPHAAGVLFTADPVTGHRKVAAVEATLGLGEALVSGTVNPDRFAVRGGEVVSKTVAAEPTLTDAQVVRLAQLGRRIEAHFGRPQDIEWCLAGDDFFIVQSRPITTLFPVPAVSDGDNHVYISVGHQQMMTDAMKPLGLSFWQMTTPAPMQEAGGRLFADATRRLSSPASRGALLDLIGRSEPRIRDALESLLERGDFIRALPDEAGAPPEAPAPIATDPHLVIDLMNRTQASVAALARDIRGKAGAALLAFILSDLQELRRILFDPRSRQVWMAAMEATRWLNEHLDAWLGEKNAADTLTLSVPNNVTSEMGLSLLDVADVVRAHPEVVAFLRRVEGDDFLDELPALPGGREARDAIEAWLDAYGMRGAGEIDITRPRFRERPSALVPLVLGHLESFEPGEAARRFEGGRRQAERRERDLLARLRALPDGARKADETKEQIERLRTFSGYREYPKFGMICRYFIYKQALLGEAERLVEARVLREKEDIFFLRFDELQEVVRTNHVDDALLRERKDAFRAYQALTPPRVFTSDGEIIREPRRRDVPAGALDGLPASAGTVEGRARVVLDMAEADLEPGDILVTAYTDPSWTPLFVAIAGLVTEVGGLMTHGAVIAREYGLPAVVGVERATRLIEDGQRIRVNGADGYVEILPSA